MNLPPFTRCAYLITLSTMAGIIGSLVVTL